MDMRRLNTIRQGMSKREKLHHYFLTDLLMQLEFDLHDQTDFRQHLPDEWEEIATRRPTPAKKKITMRLDDDVVRFFRKTGTGYLTRINDVLRAYMEARLSGMVKDGERFEKYAADAHYTERPTIGELERRFDGMDDLR